MWAGARLRHQESGVLSASTGTKDISQSADVMSRGTLGSERGLSDALPPRA